MLRRIRADHGMRPVRPDRRAADGASAAIPAGRGPGRTADEALVSLFVDRAVDYRADGPPLRGDARRPGSSPQRWPRAGRGGSACPADSRPVVGAAPGRGRRRPAAGRGGARRPRRRGDRPARSRSPRPARSCSTPGPGKAAARSPWCPTTTWPSCAPGRSSRAVPDAVAALDPRARSPGSAGPAPPATSSCAGSRACTGPRTLDIVIITAVPTGVNDQCVWVR